MNDNSLKYKKYDISYEKEVLKVFTEAFVNYPLFYNIFEDDFKTKEKFLECYRKIIKGIFKATVRKDACYVGLKDGQVASIVIVESPDNKPIGVWDYAVSGMPGVIMRLGLKNTFKFMELSERTEDVVKSIKEPHWHLYFLVVNPKLQSKGLGSDAIQNFVIPLVKDNNGKMITVTTNSENNVKFYLKNGFSLVKEETIMYNEKSLGNWTFRMDLNKEFK